MKSGIYFAAMSIALSIHDLRKTYGSGVKALRGVDLEVREGDFFALLGPNGAGKSTTIGIVCGLINKTAGEVRVFDHDIDKQREQAKSFIGLVPQEFNFNQFEPVEEIIINQAGYYGISRRAVMGRTRELLEQLGLWDKRREMARELSGGQKRRLMIARALVHRPRLLILDEPTAGVDIEGRRFMWDYLREINRQGTTIILTTHYLEEAESLCRHIAIIDHGHTIESTAMKDLLLKLHRETFVLDTRETLPAEIAIPGFETRRVDDTTLEVEVERSRSVNAMFVQLEQLGIHVISMRNKSNRLEELFLGIIEAGKA